MRQEEHQEQTILMKWWAFAHNGFGLPEECLFAIPNGGHRYISVAKALKQEGVRSGVPDLFLSVPNGDKHGLFIEMKKKSGGRVSDNQKTFISKLISLGYEACVCHGWESAKICIENYLKSE